MKAIVFTEYGPPTEVLRVGELAKPAPNAGEVLVRVVAASVGAGDGHLVRGEPFLIRLMSGIRKPKLNVPGSDLAGVVESVGAGVTKFKPSDEVYGDLSSSGFSAFAEYACAPEKAWAAKPARLTFEEAAAAPGSALAALQGLRDHGRLQAGEKVLIVGASGGVGTFAVQIARAFGAEVTGVCSTGKIDLVKSLGASRVIDYTREDVTASGDTYDLILDAGAYRSFLGYRRLLRPGGRYVLVGGGFSEFLQALLLGPLFSLRARRKMGVMLASPNPKDLETLADLLQSEKIRPVIDRRFPLEETAEAVRWVIEGRARGKEVIRIGEEN